MVRRLIRLVRRPHDIWLAINIGAFIIRAPRLIARTDLRSLLERLRANERLIRVPRSSRERVAFVRSWWLSKPFFRKYDTCYVRAMTLYRFLDAPDNDIAMHFGIEKRTNSGERLRSHAWVTLRGSLLEGPRIVLEGRVREIPFSARKKD